MNPQAAITKWLGKEICLEEEVSSTGVNAKGGAFIGFTQMSPDSEIECVAYGFHFYGQPENIKQLKEGQKIRVRGKIISIKMEDDPRVNMLMIHTEPSRLLRVYEYSPPLDEINKPEWFFAISTIYEKNPELAKKLWLGKEIIIENEIIALKFVDDNGYESASGNALILFAGQTQLLAIQKTGYIFLFDGTPDNIAKLTQGQKVKISGIVSDIKIEGDIYIIIITSSKLVD